MEYLVEFETGSDEGQIVAELSAVEAGVVPVGVEPGQVARRAATSFDDALDQLRLVANSAMRRIGQISERPDEVTIDFGIRLSADVGAVIARAAGEANLAVSLKWTRREDD